MTGTEHVSEAESARTETLRRIGRNLVNAQRIELMLKFLLKVNFSAPLAKIEDHFEKHAERISRNTMGALIRELGDIVSLPANVTDSEPEPEEVWLGTSLNIRIRAEALSAWSKEWEEIRTERNRLVHLMLGNVDYNSQDQCRTLNADLDAQNVLFLDGIEFLGPIITATKAEIAKMAASEFDLDPPLPDAQQK